MSESALVSNNVSEERVPLASKVKRWGKVILDFSPAIVGLFVGFGEPSAPLVYFGVWATIVIAVIAIIVDRIHCQHRWAAGLEASWPKLIPLTFFMMNGVLLILLYMDVVSPAWIQAWGGVITTSGIFVAMAMSLCVGRPFVYSAAVEAMPPEKLQEIMATEAGQTIFEAIMRVITLVWIAAMAILIGVGIAAAIIRESGNKNFATIFGIVAPILVVLFTVRVVSPRAIEWSKERAQAEFIPNVPNNESGGSLPANSNTNAVRV